MNYFSLYTLYSDFPNPTNPVAFKITKYVKRKKKTTFNDTSFHSLKKKIKPNVINCHFAQRKWLWWGSVSWSGQNIPRQQFPTPPHGAHCGIPRLPLPFDKVMITRSWLPLILSRPSKGQITATNLSHSTSTQKQLCKVTVGSAIH